ncbi:glyoxylase-like metal-dependent hydrolase (beta-lactamase superfamily II) [Pseudoduganella lurida]|uniref:Glyoxylase-like metal-dependent hydrolase (Beta-lactamase superfamily II) n=1 Tax=Pseudoduganella lurida TaxID=1036180 RepID=A0A562R1K7_9BURK|nr:MBL fold metallo-hydrolase [Pseudoduganella lurida]TWI62927.1 glyoxylase-like metal-dependent hydrolase (beta-lactamase superfamily II) [Pseudoduganella lurida]
MITLPDSIRVFERGWLSANNVLLVGRHDTALIDSGYVTHAPQTLELVRHELPGRRLDRLYTTHLHSDHCGGNALLEAHFGCDTFVPAPEEEKVRHWDEDALGFRALGQQCPRFLIDGVVRPGDVLTLGDLEWQVLGAPGHQAHSLIWYCAAHKLLVSADALWQNGFGVIFPELEGDEGFEEAAATLDVIAALDVEVVVPGHGAMFTDVDAALTRARRRLDFLSSKPANNAEYAVKVLLKFLLLERQRIPVADVQALLASIPVVVATNLRHLHKSEADLAAWAIKQLVRGLAAKIDGDDLVNV